MAVTITTLQNPALKWKIRDAMREAFFHSKTLLKIIVRPRGVSSVRNREGETFIRVWHERDEQSPTKGHFVFVDAKDRDLTCLVNQALCVPCGKRRSTIMKYSTIEVEMPASIPLIELMKFAGQHSLVIKGQSGNKIVFEPALESLAYRRGRLHAFGDLQKGLLRQEHFPAGSAEHYGYESVAVLHRRALERQDKALKREFKMLEV